MLTLKNAIAEKIAVERPRTERLLKEYGNVKVDEVTISQVIGGMRDIKSLVTDISYLDPNEGIRLRGFTISEVLEKLPKPEGKEYPYVEGLFYLLLTGEVPSSENVDELIEEFHQRSIVPQYVFDILRAMPRDTHPMTMFSTAILAMQRESVFAKNYRDGKFNKKTAWQDMYEDSLNLLAKLPQIAAYIYRMKYKGDTHIIVNEKLDFGSKFAKLMGFAEPYDEVARMYFVIHSDHESGNISAHTTHLVATALSDAYYSFSAGLNGLAGPLHGLANQEVLGWIQNLMQKFNGVIPSDEELKQFVKDTLNSGHVIPGYGHAVLRIPDPRYMAQREYCLKYLPNDPLFTLVSKMFEIVPKVLLEQGKAKNPWPNVDAQSGVIQWHYGLKEYDFYTVLFGVGRAFGVLANIIWDRALGYALERPKSVTTAMLEKIAGIKE